MNEDNLIAGLPGWLHTSHGLQITEVTRIAAGTATDNFRATHPAGTVMVKVYRPGTDLFHERRVLAVTGSAAQAGLPLPRLYPSTTGALLHQADGVAASVWQWCDSDTPAGPLTADVAHETGKVLARLHLHLRSHDDGSWPVAQPHYRRQTLNLIRQRFTMLARHIASLPEPTAADELNLDRITARLTELRHAPGLLESATPPQYALVHADFVRPNLLVHNGWLRAVIDMRLKVDEPARELGRLAFDVHTIAASSGWLEVAEAALTGYRAEGGIVPATAFYGCARLALLHSLCSTYPVEELLCTRQETRREVPDAGAMQGGRIETRLCRMRPLVFRGVARPRHPEHCSVQGCHRRGNTRGFCNTHYEYRRRHGLIELLDRPKSCTAPGCDAPVHGNGLCTPHYWRMFHRGTLEPYQPVRMRDCSMPKCSGPQHANGWCWKHYIREWRYGDARIPGVDKPKPTPGRCHCGALAVSKGLCKPHYARAYYEANWEELREYGRQYQKAHPEQYCAADARRRKRAGEGLDALDKALAVDYRIAIANDPCGYCGSPADHTDHVFPIAQGGRDIWFNLMRACEPCNLTKGPRCGTWFRLRTGSWHAMRKS